MGCYAQVQSRRMDIAPSFVDAFGHYLLLFGVDPEALVIPSHRGICGACSICATVCGVHGAVSVVGSEGDVPVSQHSNGNGADNPSECMGLLYRGRAVDAQKDVDFDIASSVSKWVDVDLEKGIVEAEWTLPLYRAHPRVEREDNFVKRNWKDLTWNAVAWFLETSRQASIVDLALRSIRTLPYVPRKARELLSTRIPRLLYSRIVKEHEGDVEEETEEEVNPKEIYEYTLSFIHILKCITLDAGNAEDLAPLISLPNCVSSSIYRPLDESMLQSWNTYKTSSTAVDAWPIHNYVALISMEMLFYQIHPKTATGDDIDPLHEMYVLLEWHVSQKKSLKGRALALLLDSLVYVLARTKDENIRQRTFDVLVRVVRTLGRRDCLVFRPLAACFKLLLTMDEEERRSILVAHVNVARECSFAHGPKSGFRMLLDTLNKVVIDQDSSIRAASGILRSVFVLVANSLPVDVAVTEPIIQKNLSLLQDKLLGQSDEEWQQYHHPFWIAEFLCYIYSLKGHSETLLEVFRRLMSFTRFHTEDEQVRILRKPFDLMRSRLNSGDANQREQDGICTFLVKSLVDSVQEQEGRWTLIRMLAEDTWLSDVMSVLAEMDTDTKIRGQAMLGLWQERMPVTDEWPVTYKQFFEMLRSVFTITETN